MGCLIGEVELRSLELYAILFLWQFPHFMAIAWMFREDYWRAGYLVLPPGEKSGTFMSWQALMASSALIPVSLAPSVIGGAGVAYTVGACVLSSAFLFYSVQLARRKSNLVARQLLIASIIYLPSTFFLMILSKQ
jgi:protoheme IX farnesyltransferase